MVKRLNLPRYPVIGATLIGRLARDLGFKGKGVGELLLADALRRSLEARRRIASAAVIVDAKDTRAYAFYAGYGFIAFPDSAKRLFLPMQTIANLYSAPTEPVSEPTDSK
jgi:predicted GNAT family N-acyltransferase